MQKISTSTARRGLDLLRLAGTSLRLSKTENKRVAENSRRYLAQSMGRMKGLPQKIGQLLTMAEGETAESLEGLTEDSEPLEFSIIEQILAHEWNRPWREVLLSLEPVGKAASLGQVHKGRLHNGDEVAVKVQYPGIARALNTDLKLLGWLSAPVGGFGQQFDLEGYREVLLNGLEEELDYFREAENQHLYSFLSKYHHTLVIPKVYGEWSTSRVLVSSWEDGATLREIASEWNEQDRKAAGVVFLNHVLSFFQQGIVHADPHPGNIRFQRSAPGEVKLLLYDFGCIHRAELPQRLAWLRLIQLAQENGTGDPFPWFVEAGFTPEYLEPLAAKLPALCRVLFEPFIIKAPYDLSNWNLGNRVSAVLGEDRWNFRIAGPPEMIYLMRLFQGLLYTLKKLNVPINWNNALASTLTHFEGQLAAIKPKFEELPARGFSLVAKNLHVRVTRNGETRVRLTSPVHLIDSLEQVMDLEVLEELKRQAINVSDLVSQVQKSGYKAQEVFQLHDEERDVRVWLE